MATNREYIEQRLAEINAAANKPQPAMGYWKALQQAARYAARRETAAKRDEAGA